MRRLLFAFAVMSAACHASVRRVYMLSPADAAQYRYRSTVLAIRRGDETISVRNGSLVHDGTTAKVLSFDDVPTYQAHEVPLRSNDLVKLRVYFHDGDYVPREGVVHSDGNASIGGIVLATLGSGVFALGAAVAFQTCVRDPAVLIDFHCGFDQLGGAFLMVAGGVGTIAGIVTAVVLESRDRLASTAVNVTPIVSRNGGGGALQIRF